MRLPLWVYLIYQGSYDESVEHINSVMGNYKNVTQTRNFEFSLDDEYFRPALYSTDYEHKFVYEPEPMPAYWASLEGMSTADAKSWAAANGVALNVTTIKYGESGYDKSYEGLVVSQSPRYGSLVSEYPSGSIVVMGPAQIDPNKQVPDFIEHNYSKAVTWAKEHHVPYTIEFDLNAEGKIGDVIKQTPDPGTDISTIEKIKLVVVAGITEIKFDTHGVGKAPDPITVITGDDTIYFKSISDPTGEYQFIGWFTSSGEDGIQVYSTDEVGGNVTLHAHWKKIDKEHVHEWVLVYSEEATCDHAGVEEYGCTCGETKIVDIPQLSGSACGVTPVPEPDPGTEPVDPAPGEGEG